MEDLIRLTAREAVGLLKKGAVSPLELIAAAERRISRVEPEVNALPTLCLDRARERAARLMQDPPSDPPPGYLYGLPVAIKDLVEVAGVRTTYGSPIYAGHVPVRSDYSVEHLEANGAVVIAKSNTPEFGAGANTFNEVFGATRNPWNTAMTCGGSSGGAAVALATGEVWLAEGSDLGGSLRIPASFCSVVGLRPSPGRVARGPKVLPFDTLAVCGPMGRNAGDVALLLDAQAGRHPGDPLSLPVPPRPYVEAVDRPWKPRRIGFSPDLGIAPVDPEVKEICRQAAEAWAGTGVTVEQACPDFREAEAVFQVLRAALFAARFEPLLKAHRDLLKPEIIWNIEQGLALTAEKIGWAERMRGELLHRTVAFFERYDLLLCPAVVAPPFDITLRYLTEVDGKAFDSYIGWLVMTFALTLTACPAMSVPCGFTRSGLPVGLQMLAPPWREDLLLGAAARFERLPLPLCATPIDPIGPDETV